MNLISILKRYFKQLLCITGYEYELQVKMSRAKSVRFAKRSKNPVFYTYSRLDYDRRPTKKQRFRTYSPYKEKTWEAAFSEFNLVEIHNSEFDQQVIANTKANRRRTSHGVAVLAKKRNRG